VYLVGHVVAPTLAMEQAALLGCGDGAVLSHHSAAKLWRLLTSPPRTILDLAIVLDDEELESIVAEASYRGLASEAELRAVNARVHGYEVDFLWRGEGLAAEVNGYDAHSGRIAFERDHLKVATLGAHGVQVMPVTGRRIREDPEGVVDRLRHARGQCHPMKGWRSM
jgi:very-short-patch-repair endonuclease